MVVAPSGRTAAAALKMQAHPLCFIAFERAGVGLFLFHAHIVQDVKNGPALHFELSR